MGLLWRRGHGFGDRWTRFSKDEQITLMTLWCIFRSPLMVGCELRDNDEWTLSLLTNSEVLRVLKHSHSGRQLFRYGQYIAWMAIDEDGSYYLAVFNTGLVRGRVEVQLSMIGLPSGDYIMRDLWTHEDMGTVNRIMVLDVLLHGARLVKLTKKDKS